jgi:hypothetical protein
MDLSTVALCGDAEEAFMNSLISFNKDPTVFLTRPICGAVLVLTVVRLLAHASWAGRARMTARERGS